MNAKDRNNTVTFTDPPFTTALFGKTKWAWIWLVARLYLGYTWLEAGIGKLSNPAWVSGGEALKGFWENAVAIPNAPARPPIAYGWYRVFIQFLLDGGHYTWFSKLVIAGELLIGTALILGVFVGIAAFFGAFLNWNFMMAGSASMNPMMLVISILLVLAWKTAGWWGLDRWVLTALGTPWQPGRLMENRQKNNP